MDVLITEISTGKFISKYPVVLGGQNYTPSEKEYFDQAWRCAVEDGLVKEDRRGDFRFQLAQQ